MNKFRIRDVIDVIWLLWYIISKLMTNKFLKSGNYDTIIKDYSIAITILILV